MKICFPPPPFFTVLPALSLVPVFISLLINSVNFSSVVALALVLKSLSSLFPQPLGSCSHLHTVGAWCISLASPFLYRLESSVQISHLNTLMSLILSPFSLPASPSNSGTLHGAFFLVVHIQHFHFY